MKNLSLLLTSLLTLAYLATSHQQVAALSLSTNAPQWTRLTYLLMHANPIHLIVNLISLLTLAFIAEARLGQFAVATLISTTIPSAIIVDTPMCGISALNYALTGLIVMRSRRWAQYLIINIICILPTFFIPSIAAAVHLYAFMAGAIISFLTTPHFHE